MDGNGLKGKAAVVTGGGGVLGRAMAVALARSGAKVAVIGRTRGPLDEAVEEFRTFGADGLAVVADVLDEEACRRARGRIADRFGCVDILVNAAGGASPAASTDVEQILPPRSGEGADLRTVLDIPADAFRATADLNFLGTFLPTQAFLPDLLEARGCIVNITSMGAQWPLTKSPAYSAGKAAVENYTKWLATHLARAGVRVNAISPGFFLTRQNRFLLIDEKTGELKPRGRKILDKTPMGRFGEPEELCGALLWLVSEGAGFVTGAVVPVDGGFGSYGGV